MLDAAIDTSFLVVGQVVLQENTLLANLSEIKTAIEDGQQIGMLGRGPGGCRCPEKLGHGRSSRWRWWWYLTRWRGLVIFTVVDHGFLVHGKRGTGDGEGRAWILGIIGARLVRYGIIEPCVHPLCFIMKKTI
jgi:hypothetical protein